MGTTVFEKNEIQKFLNRNRPQSLTESEKDKILDFINKREIGLTQHEKQDVIDFLFLDEELVVEKYDTKRSLDDEEINLIISSIKQDKTFLNEVRGTPGKDVSPNDIIPTIIKNLKKDKSFINNLKGKDGEKGDDGIDGISIDLDKKRLMDELLKKLKTDNNFLNMLAQNRGVPGGGLGERDVRGLIADVVANGVSGAGPMLRRERSVLLESPAGTFVTPEDFDSSSIIVFRNGQALGISPDNGITIVSANTFKFNESIDRDLSCPDDIIALYTKAT